jgi:hypothetical protein
MFGARGTYRRQGMHTEFWWGDLMEWDHLEDLQDVR